MGLSGGAGLGSEKSGTFGTGVLNRAVFDGCGAGCGTTASSAFGAKRGCGLNSEAGAPKEESAKGCDAAGGICPSNWALLKPESVCNLAAANTPVEPKGSNGLDSAIRGPVGCAVGWQASADAAGGAPKALNSEDAGDAAGVGVNNDGTACCGAAGSGGGGVKSEGAAVGANGLSDAPNFGLNGWLGG